MQKILLINLEISYNKSVDNIRIILQKLLQPTFL